MAYVAPSVTPYYSLNPSYRLYTVSVAGEILDTRTFVMDLKEANKHPDKDPLYYQLYSARKDYNMKVQFLILLFEKVHIIFRIFPRFPGTSW